MTTNNAGDTYSGVSDRLYWPICNPCEMGLSRPLSDKRDAEAVSRRHEKKWGHSTAVVHYNPDTDQSGRGA